MKIYYKITRCVFTLFTAFLLSNCDNNVKTIEVKYLNEGVLYEQTIPFDFVVLKRF